MPLYPQTEPYAHGMLAVGDGNLAAAYGRPPESPGPEVRQRAARARTDGETATVPAPPRSVERFEDPLFRQGFARTVTHYRGNGHFLRDGDGSGGDRGDGDAGRARRWPAIVQESGR
ncbi:hypothetical protein GCM10010206_44400 [Streptomyces cinerochromogenes]|nr:hypothetical protein GCM10010206_44400 [Streptomyces cinerochromogenes]